MRVGRRHVQLRAVGVLYGEDFAASSVQLDLGRADEASHAVVDVDHVLARLEVVEVAEPHSLRSGGTDGPRLLLGEDPVRLRDDEQGWPVPARQLESARESVHAQYLVAAPLCGGDVHLQAPARGVEELRMVRLVRSELGEAGKGGRLEGQGRRSSRRRVAGVDDDRGAFRVAEGVRVVLYRKDGVPLRHQVEERRVLLSASRDVLRRWEEFGGRDTLDGELGRGVEGPKALKIVSEELGADGELLARTPGVDDSAADRVVALPFDDWHAVVPALCEAFADFRELGASWREPYGSDGTGRHWRREGELRGRDDAGVGRHVPRPDCGQRLEACSEKGLVAVKKRRKLQYAGSESRGTRLCGIHEEPEVV